MTDKVLDSEGKSAKVAYACRVNGFKNGRMVDLEYAEDGQGLVHVQITRLDNKCTKRGTGCWPLEAIRNRDAKGLRGFIEFAKRVGVTGAQLANVVEQHNHADSK